MKEKIKIVKPFGLVRSFLWPIYSYELKKLVPMFCLFFLISFSYNLLRNMKISVVVTLKSSGAQVIPYLKIVGVLPVALFMTYIFTKLINKYTREQVFYLMLSGFLLYFLLFLLFLFPFQNYLELNKTADFLITYVFISEGFSGFISIVRHWNLSLFYILSEMWSAIVLSMLFWGFANEVTKVNEAKRFYAIFALGANASGIFIGFFINWLEKLNLFYISFYCFKYQWVFYQLLTIILIGLIIMLLFFILNNYILEKDIIVKKNIYKKDNVFSLKECFFYLRKSRYLAYIVIIVVSYNIIYNLADVLWTYKVNQVYNNSKDLNSYISRISLVTGIIATVAAFIISGNVIRRYGWTIAALITPIIWFLTSIGFLSGLLLEDVFNVEVLYAFLGNPANYVLLMGAIQVCLGRGCKYTVFDETKEIVFIPLSKENQRKSKAIVDGIASRFGKSGGSLIYIFLLMIFGEISFTIPYVAFLIFVSMFIWMFAVLKLGKLANKTIDLEYADKGVIFDDTKESLYKKNF
ncbi:MAG: Npt1/Npt2 family nucleotide transporter [Enterobacteriaceae bacterium]|nr:Npt1/Npt2 family nucleotide transporter [Enterobacteriaceae bacterium]